MCGLAGYLGGKNQLATNNGKNILKRMVDKIAHRDPDDDGYWHDAEEQIVSIAVCL